MTSEVMHVIIVHCYLILTKKMLTEMVWEILVTLIWTMMESLMNWITVLKPLTQTNKTLTVTGLYDQLTNFSPGKLYYSESDK